MKNNMRIIFTLCIAASATLALPAINPSKTLWDNKPAAIWEECFPQGDGRLGIMADGGVTNETVVVNDITLWSGSEYDYSNPEAASQLPLIRQLLFEGKNAEAQKVMYEHFVPKKPTTGGTYGCYQMLADLNINYIYDTEDIEPTAYVRSLDLDAGTSTTTFTLPDGTTYTRLYAVPRGFDGILIRITASRPGAVNFRCNLSRPGSTPGTSLKGELDSGRNGVGGMRFAATVNAATSGEQAVVNILADSIIEVCNADSAWIAVAAATSYLWPENYSEAASTSSIALLKHPEQTVSDGARAHRALMERAEVFLPAGTNSYLPTPQRLAKFQSDDSDAALAALYYNYGRYLSVASTRPDLLPPNLQGLWANQIDTPWNGDYHTNINVQMNHWHVEQGNLSELHVPLFELVKRAIPSGQRTAKAFYGDNAQGWVMHMMTNIWNYTEPGEHPSWGATNTGGAWLCNHLWEHFLYTGDKDFLSEVYPAMKGASEFFLSTMVNEPSNGWFVTSPSSSPENEFYMPGDSVTKVSVCMGPAMDTQIIGELWSNVAQAANILQIDAAFADSLMAAIDRLPPMRIDSEGRLMEWLEEYAEADRQHRHVSHLYGLYPGNSITADLTPELAVAAAKSLDVRGDDGTGWSRAWKINFHARLHNGNRAWKVLKGLLQPAIIPDNPHRRAGTFPNLFCSHPPFQIDGNYGGAAGIGEMLIQSHQGFIELLPALPSAMPSGSLKGFKARGGAEISLVWENGLPLQATVTGGHENSVRIKYPKGVTPTVLDPAIPFTIDDNTLCIPLACGQQATIAFKSSFN